MISSIIAFFNPVKPLFDAIGKALGPILKFIGKYWREFAILILLWFLWNRTEDLRAAETGLEDAADTIVDLVAANQTTQGSLDTCIAVNKANEAAKYDAQIRALAAEIRLAEMESLADREVNEIDEQAEEIRELVSDECVRLDQPMPDFLFGWLSDDAG